MLDSHERDNSIAFIMREKSPLPLFQFLADHCPFLIQGAKHTQELITQKGQPFRKMPEVESTDHARAQLAIMIAFIAQGESFWYTINGDPSYEFSLCRRLGFTTEIKYIAFMVSANLAGYVVKPDGKKRFEINRVEFESFVRKPEYGLSSEIAEFETSFCDIKSLLSGKNQVKANRFHFHVIRIGNKYHGYPHKFTKQKKDGTKKLTTTPPKLNSLRQHQRTLGRNTSRAIADTIIDNDDVFNDAEKQLGKPDPESDADAEPDSPEKAIQLDPTPMPTPSPPKRNRSEMSTNPTNVSTPPTTSNQSVPPPAKSYAKRQKYYYAMRALENEGIDDIFSEGADEVSGYLLSELISLRQERAGGNTVVLNYNEIQNSKEKNFVRVSITNDTNDSFNKNAKWVELHLYSCPN